MTTTNYTGTGLSHEGVLKKLTRANRGDSLAKR